MKPTVHDIAAHAGVSLATVDRVLNRRPGVRGVTRDRVENAIVELGYVRDVAAANLAKSRLYPFVFIVPTSDNSFMVALRREVEEVAKRGAIDRLDLRVVDVPAFDAAALARAIENVRADGPSGVALVAVDAPEVADAINRLVEDGIPVVTLVSDLPTSQRQHYAGIDNISAGRTAASLLGRFAGGRQGSLLVLAGSMLVRDHRERLEGFQSVVASDFPSLSVLPVLEGRDDPKIAEDLVTNALRHHPDVLGIYSLGAGNRGLVRALERRSAETHIFTIAHELTGTTRKALQLGLIDAVLNQDPGHEVRSAIRVLKAKADKQPIVEAQERIRLDIFLKDNLP
ncbi:LacI family DNA-binding transcriptional regulator [Ciceribacter sp. L1K23]|uniref:LacI family DNA-binding transcriptional regulator n=1 Tax=Ciceribacter sp. L1K23 TaxID=2820276 RepID=UPI001B838CCF|nr:LacI family DNA-binding transcriptional regulator [Ciceribacter sp. L1K23]MBR0558080.1 LacI family DNA-binding transcriptional regulator [Ciceribacter sp. L1K23]